MKRHAKAILATSALLLTLVLGVTLASAAAPVVSVEDASNVAYTSADVKGTVNPEGQFTTWRFQYISDTQFQENLTNSLPGFEGASTGIEEGTETEETLERQLGALKPSTTYRLRLQAENGEDQSEAVATSTFTTLAVATPTVAIDPVTTFTGTSAHFSGQVNPNAPEAAPVSDPKVEAAFSASWHFECTPSCPNLSGGTVAADNTAHTVEADTSGLEPNTTYVVSLVAENAGGQASNGPQSFKTNEVVPETLALYAGSVDTDSAVLGAMVNPKNSPVTYQFQWGTDTNYGNLIPAAPQALGAEDNAFHAATAPISGLQQGETYHFRVLARNTETSEVSEGEDHSFTMLEPAGPPTSCSNSEFRTGYSLKLLDCRAYEMISPLDKNGSDIENTDTAYVLVKAAADGDSVAYNSLATFAGQSGAPQSQYLSSRTSDGWNTTGLNPPIETTPALNATLPLFNLFSEDLSKVVFGTRAAILGSNTTSPDAYNLYLRNNNDGSYNLLTPGLPPEAPSDLVNADVGAGAISKDGSHVLFEDVRQLLTDEPILGHFEALYDWSANGGLHLVSVLPDGSPTTAVPGIQQAQSSGDGFPGTNVISDDGSHIFFTTTINAGAEARKLFVRINNSSTHWISASEAAIPSSSDEPFFQGASSDGRIAYFVSEAKLTNDATAAPSSPDLYRWEQNAPDGQHHITDLTTSDPGGGGVGYAPDGQGNWSGVIGVTDDGSRLYFVASGDLAPGAVKGEPNLYRWDQSSGIRFLVSLDGTPTGGANVVDGSVWNILRFPNPQTDNHYRESRMTPSGNQLLFASRARLTAYNNNNHRQIYLYDATRDELECVSCSPRTAASAADASLITPSSLTGGGGFRVRGTHQGLSLPRNVSADGTRVVFDSPEALVAGDTNGQVDVYQWHSGELSLISSGTSFDASTFVDASVTGDDVFFTTRQRLTSSDQGELRDIYDARVGGGHLEPPSTPICEGDACQAPPVVPNDLTSSSSTFLGPGNPKRVSHRARHQTCKRGRVLKKGKCVKRKPSKKSSERGKH